MNNSGMKFRVRLVVDGVDDFEFAFSNLEYRKIIKDYK